MLCHLKSSWNCQSPTTDPRTETMTRKGGLKWRRGLVRAGPKLDLWSWYKVQVLTRWNKDCRLAQYSPDSWATVFMFGSYSATFLFYFSCRLSVAGCPGWRSQSRSSRRRRLRLTTGRMQISFASLFLLKLQNSSSADFHLFAGPSAWFIWHFIGQRHFCFLFGPRP